MASPRHASHELYPAGDHGHPPSGPLSAATGIVAVGGALVGAVMRGATHVTHTLAGPSIARKAAARPSPAPPPATPVSPSDGRRWEAKVDQVIHRFYIKTAQVIIDSRLERLSEPASCGHTDSTHSSFSQSLGHQTTVNSSAERLWKRDKWFNLELQDPDYFKDELRTWKSASTLFFNSLSPSFPSLSEFQQQPNFNSIPVMIFETILDLQSLPTNAILILKDSDEKDIRLNHPSSFARASSPNIVIERWTVTLGSPMPLLPGPELPTVYRHCVIHFRALYSLCQTLPAWPLFKRLKKPGTREHDFLKIGCRLSSASVSDELERLQQGLNRMSFTDEIGIDQRLSDTESETHLGSFEFPRVQTPFGVLESIVTYRTQVEFYISDREAALSSRFMDEDRFLSPESINPCTRFTADHHRSGYSVPNPAKPLSSSSQLYDQKSLLPRPQHLASKPSYGSLSSRHPLHRRSESYQDDLNPQPAVGTSNSSFLTAAIRAAAESSAFPSASSACPSNPPINLTSHVVQPSPGQSSALTAKLVAKCDSLPPVLSNALPSPLGTNRGLSHNRLPSLNCVVQQTPLASGASPRQPSVLSSSPLSCPSSSIRISSNRSHNHLASSPSSYHSSIAPRPMPTPRRYSSPRNYNYCQTSSGGTLESSSLSRRALLNSSSENSNDAGEINSFLAMLDSKPSLKRTHHPNNPTSILSRSQAELTMKRLAGSVHSAAATPGSISAGKQGSMLQGLMEEDESQGHAKLMPAPQALEVSPSGFVPPTVTKYSPVHHRRRLTSVSGSIGSRGSGYPDTDDGEVVGKLELSFGHSHELSQRSNILEEKD